MKDGVDAGDGSAGDAGFAQIGVHEFELAAGDVGLDVIEVTAGEIVHGADGGAFGDELIGESGADEGGSAGDEDFLSGPKRF